MRARKAVKAGDKAAVRACCSSASTSTLLKPTGPLLCTGPFARTIWHMVNKLLAAGADAKAANRYGVTPLYLACVNGEPAHDRKAAESRSRSERRHDRRRNRADDRRAHRESSKPPRFCSTHGAKVDAREEWHGQTALMWAVR